MDQLELDGMPAAVMDTLTVQLTWSVMGRPSVRVCCRRHGCSQWGRAECLDLPPSSDEELLTAIDGTVRAAIARSHPVR